MEKTECFKKADIRRPEGRCEEYLGWIYITLNEKAAPVATMLAPLLEHVTDYNMQDYVTIFTEDHVWDTNWKCLTENFMEGYHLPVHMRQRWALISQLRKRYSISAAAFRISLYNCSKKRARRRLARRILITHRFRGNGGTHR